MTGNSTAISFTISESETMVEILCPHCEEEVELDDDAIGTIPAHTVMVSLNGV